MQNMEEQVTREVDPARSWVHYLQWLGVKVEGPKATTSGEE